MIIKCLKGMFLISLLVVGYIAGSVLSFMVAQVV
jgi:hypothetical protein